MQLLSFFVIALSILVSVAFYTLLERKILGYIQIRKGPNKVSFLGILQPMADAMKLFNKNLTKPDPMNYIFMIISPSLTLVLNLCMWPLLPYSKYSIIDSNYNLLIYLILSSLTVYSILSIGWTANSKYSHLGSIRSVAQIISYEINFFLIILFFIILSHSYFSPKMQYPNQMLPLLTGTLLLLIIWIPLSLAEVNRSPFDFAEGESELVSGFNVEFMGGWFALIFLAEYANMLILSFISSVMFFYYSNLTVTLMMILFAISFLWIRGTFPRFRYDMLMALNWLIFLPLSLWLITPVNSFIFWFY